MNNYLSVEFTNNIRKIKGVLERLVNPYSELYIEKIIISNPLNMINIAKRLFCCCKNIYVNGNRIISRKGIMKESVLKKIMVKIFNYNKFSTSGFKNWNAYDLCEELNIKVCPYCNRNIISVVRNSRENIIRGSLDHYFSQSKYPILGLSFYNLIPSCSTCNSEIKGNKDLKLKSNLHPYTDTLDECYKFDYDIDDINAFDGDIDKFNITIYKKYENKDNSITYINDKSNNTLRFFKIEEIYQTHKDIVAELICSRRKYPDSLIEEIAEIMMETHKCSKDEAIINFTNDLFGIHNQEDVIDTQYGKLKDDIINKLLS